MDDYSFARDLLETWRSTTDWVKFVMLVAVPGWLGFLIHQLLRYRAERRLVRDHGAMSDRHVRELVEAEICRIIAEWERTQLADDRPKQLPRPQGRLQ